jgi:hypothetical protein
MCSSTTNMGLTLRRITLACNVIEQSVSDFAYIRRNNIDTVTIHFTRTQAKLYVILNIMNCTTAMYVFNVLLTVNRDISV